MHGILWENDDHSDRKWIIDWFQIIGLKDVQWWLDSLNEVPSLIHS